MTDLNQLQADADAISRQSPAIRKFAEDTVAYLKAQVQPAPTPAPTPSPTSPQTAQWYAAGAVVKPIPANPPISPYSAQIVAQLQPQGTNAWNKFFLCPRNRDPVAYPDVSVPLVTVQVNYPTVNASTLLVPIPAGIKLAGTYAHGDSENYLVVMGPNGDEWDLYDLSAPGDPPYPGSSFGGQGAATANQFWQAAEATHYAAGTGTNCGWTGVGNQTIAGTDSGLLEGFGIIRLRDTQQTPVGGNWGHALNWTGWFSCATQNVNNLPAVVPPATGGGDRFTGIAGCYPDGARLQIDPSINVDTWPSLASAAEWRKQMCRTLQSHGMIAAHGATGQGDGDGFRAEYSGNFPAGSRYPWQAADGSWPADPYDPTMAVPADLLPHFRVIDWTKWTGA